MVIVVELCHLCERRVSASGLSLFLVFVSPMPSDADVQSRLALVNMHMPRHAPVVTRPPLAPGSVYRQNTTCARWSPARCGVDLLPSTPLGRYTSPYDTDAAPVSRPMTSHALMNGHNPAPNGRLPSAGSQAGARQGVTSSSGRNSGSASSSASGSVLSAKSLPVFQSPGVMSCLNAAAIYSRPASKHSRSRSRESSCRSRISSV